MGRLRTLSLIALLLLATVPGPAAEVADGYVQGPGGYYRRDDRSGPYAISTDGRVMLMGLPMPFVRAAEPFILVATATPTQYLITQPERTSSYFGINPCPNLDIRVKSVKATSVPMVTEATPYAGVRRVTSPTEVVTDRTGTRFIRSSFGTYGSSPNPMGGSQRVVSIMVVAPPNSGVDVSGAQCPFELQYGNGS